MADYVLVTAACNEEKFIESTIKSVINQDKKPVEWIIVNDGSTDNTAEIVKKYAEKYNYIKLITSGQQNKRDFTSKVFAINKGVKIIESNNFNFIGVLDADVSFDKNYYSSLIKKFEGDPTLGIVGGKFYDIVENKKILMGFSPYSVRGATQFFRRQCFESIGGLTPMRFGGEDALACYAARMKGWQIKNYSDLTVLHLRPTGTVGMNILKTKYRAGLVEYHLGYHPLFQFAKCIKRVREKPVIVGSLLRFVGFWWATIKQEKRIISREQRIFIYKDQINRLIKLNV